MHEVITWLFFATFSTKKSGRMNFIDMFVAVLLIYAIVRGIARGLIMQLASLGALMAGIFGALTLLLVTVRFIA